MSDFAGSSGFNNKGLTIIFDDEPGDTTVRPAPPELRAFLEAEWEKIRQWEASQKPQSQEKPK